MVRLVTRFRSSLLYDLTRTLPLTIWGLQCHHSQGPDDLYRVTGYCFIFRGIYFPLISLMGLFASRFAACLPTSLWVVMVGRWFFWF